MDRPPTAVELAMAERRRRLPPLYPLNSRGFDRVQAIGGLLDLPPALQRLCDEGKVVYGEIGDTKPDARTVPIGHDGYVCEITSGMMDFLYAISRAASGVSVVYDPAGNPRNARAGTVDEMSALIGGTFSQWRKFCTPSLFDAFWKQKRIEHATFTVGEAARSIADELATWAEAFTLAHELGHASLNSGIVTSPQPLEELRADSVGLDIFLDSPSVRANLRLALAGMALSIRVFAGLERAGVVFSRAYPAQETRIEMLVARLRAKSPSQQHHDEVSTVLVAHLDLLDDVDRRLSKGKLDPSSTAWRRRVAVIAALQSLVTQKRPRSDWLGMFALAAAHAQPGELADLARTLLAYYAETPSQESFFTENIRTGMGRALAACIPELPEPHRALFKPAEAGEAAVVKSTSPGGEGP